MADKITRDFAPFAGMSVTQYIENTGVGEKALDGLHLGIIETVCTVGGLDPANMPIDDIKRLNAVFTMRACVMDTLGESFFHVIALRTSRGERVDMQGNGIALRQFLYTECNGAKAQVIEYAQCVASTP